ncbi:MAG: lipid-binding SYLF domain-containing protein [Campylobacterota bacterium]
MTKRLNKLTLITLLIVLLSTFASAETAAQIDAKADKVIEIFKKKHGAANFLAEVQGYLVFPSVMKGGFFIGGEYGEGVLRVNGKSTAYYNIASGSLGFQLGAQKASYLIAFASQRSLENFRRSNGWEAGVDGAITVVDWGAGKDIGSISFEKPIYAFVFNAKGLMGSISLEGTKFTKIQPGKTVIYDKVDKLTN